MDTSFAVGDNWMLSLENFVGNVTVKTGAADIIFITATKRAKKEEDLDEIILEYQPQSGGTIIVTDDPSHVEGGAVDFDMTIPPDARLHLTNGVGSISYTGRPDGTSHFETGVGGIRFNLPVDVNLQVELSVGVGNIYSDFRVNGLVDQHAVNGVIGTGMDGKIVAHVGVGNLRLSRN